MYSTRREFGLQVVGPRSCVAELCIGLLNPFGGRPRGLAVTQSPIQRYSKALKAIQSISRKKFIGQVAALAVMPVTVRSLNGRDAAQRGVRFYFQSSILYHHFRTLAV
jgi:hypothetical protein